MKTALFLFMIFFANISFAADKIICIVNDKVITENELQEFVSILKYKIMMGQSDQRKAYSRFKEEEAKSLNKMVEDRLMTQAAEAKGYIIPEELIEKRLMEFREQFKTEEEFEESLVSRGINVKLLKQKLHNQILMQQIVNDEVRSKVKTKPYQITDYYKSHLAEFTDDAKIKYRAIVTEEENVADAAYEGFMNAENIENIFNLYKDKVTNGTLNEMEVAEELKILFDQKNKKVFHPIKIAESFYVFVVEERLAKRFLDLKEVYNDVSNRLFEENFNRTFAEWVDKLKKDAVIKIVDHAEKS